MKLQNTNEKETLRQNEKKESLTILEDYIKKLEIPLGYIYGLDLNNPIKKPNVRLFQLLGSGLCSKAESIITELNFILDSSIFNVSIRCSNINKIYNNEFDEIKRLYIRSEFLKKFYTPSSFFESDEKRLNDYVERVCIPNRLTLSLIHI